MDNIQRNMSSRNIMWYRDGSKTQDRTGAGIFGPEVINRDDGETSQNIS